VTDGQKARPRIPRSPTITKERKKELDLFERQASVRFRSRELLNLAFSHRSFANESSGAVGADRTDNNEKLEFLGDAVLGLVVSEMLFERLAERTEGEMARVKSVVVSEASLARIAQWLGMQNYILIGRGEENSGGRSKRAILADATEALIGALYLDSGFTAAARFVRRLLEPEISAVLENRHQRDYKTLLQELVQKRFRTYPRYNLVQKSGPDHDRTFHVRVVIDKRECGEGAGKNKKEAEQNAAEQAYRELGGDVEAAEPPPEGGSHGERRSRSP
jgi:ribonuclease III